jgi:transposase
MADRDGSHDVSHFWAGIDWSEGLNDVAVVDRHGAVVERARIPESPEGVAQLLRLLAGLRTSHRHSRRQVPVAIESGSTLLVAGLRRARQPVVVIPPTMAARYRSRISPTRRKKSDAGDAAMLANILRVDGLHHRQLPDLTDTAEAITVLTRSHTRAGWSRQYHANRLRTVLRSIHPAGITAWADLPDGFRRTEARALLALAPTPRAAARLDVMTIARTLTDAGRTRMSWDRALRLHAAFAEPVILRPPVVEKALGAEVLACLAQLDTACSILDTLAAQVEDTFHSHPHAPIYRSFPGCGPIIAARLLGEIGDDPDRFATARGLRAYAGSAPLTWASGTSVSVSHRRIANRWLKSAGHVWAFTSLTRSPGCRAHYDRRRAAGDKHTAALRNLFNRLIGCLHHCLLTGKLYNEDIAFPAP